MSEINPEWIQPNTFAVKDSSRYLIMEVNHESRTISAVLANNPTLKYDISSMQTAPRTELNFEEIRPPSGKYSRR